MERVDPARLTALHPQFPYLLATPYRCSRPDHNGCTVFECRTPQGWQRRRATADA